MVRFSLVNVVSSFWFLSTVAASVILTQYRTRLRRQMNDRDVVSDSSFKVKTRFWITKRLRAAFIPTACSTMKRWSTSAASSMRVNGIRRRFTNIRLSSIESLVSMVHSIWALIEHFIAVSLNILNLVQNFIIVGNMFILRGCLLMKL